MSEELLDETLIEICRIPEDGDLREAVLTDMRIVSRLVGEGPGRTELECAIALLAAAASRLPHLNPTHLPFGYDGPTTRSAGWIERTVLERLAKQVVGLKWTASSPAVVAHCVDSAVDGAVRLGFLEIKEYDAWKPGMVSGTGWREAVAATPYGVTKARPLPASRRNAHEPHMQPGATGTGQAVSPSAELLPEVPPTIRTLIQNRDRMIPVNGPAGPAKLPLTTGATEAPKPKCPPVVLGDPGGPCHVLEIEKRPLTDGQYAVVEALLKAGREGLSKDALEAVRPSARRMLKALCQDRDWKKVILLPGQTNGRYRIRL